MLITLKIPEKSGRSQFIAIAFACLHKAYVKSFVYKCDSVT